MWIELIRMSFFLEMKIECKKYYLHLLNEHSKSKEGCSSGLRGALGKRIYPKRVSRVRIPLSPQNIFFKLNF